MAASAKIVDIQMGFLTVAFYFPVDQNTKSITRQ
jgi:hypothetical protein